LILCHWLDLNLLIWAQFDWFDTNHRLV
jgi:hypothetical protein